MLRQIRIVHLKPALIAASVITLIGFVGIIDVHEVIPGSHVLDWLTLPFLYGGFALGIMKSELSAWLLAWCGFCAMGVLIRKPVLIRLVGKVQEVMAHISARQSSFEDLTAMRLVVNTHTEYYLAGSNQGRR